MKLRLHHIEICVKDPIPLVKLLCGQLGLNLLGYRETRECIQYLLKLSKTAFIVTSRKGEFFLSQNNNNNDNYSELIHGQNFPLDPTEHWSLFCCTEDKGEDHIDSVFNVAVEVKDLKESLQKVRESGGATILQDIQSVSSSDDGVIHYAIIKSCCGNVIHTMIQKTEYNGWFLPGFNKIRKLEEEDANYCNSKYDHQQSHISERITMSHFDHFTLACRIGETDEIIKWYETTFGMKRFITNRQDLEDEGLVIGDDVGLRLKVMEFWKCSEAGLASQNAKDDEDEEWEPLKIVIAESLPNINNTQIESFLSEHGGPGVQHVGLHTENMVETVRELTKLGVKFRHPPPTYYTEIGQLNVIKSSGEDVDTLRQLGILLDDEADVFDNQEDNCTAGATQECYLMQVFTHPIFNQDTFFLEVIQRRGARGFGVGNVTALARSVNAYKKMLQLQNEEEKTNELNGQK